MEENIQKYEFEKDKKKYILSTSIIGGKYIKIVCNPKNQKYGYINQFSKDDLININNIFKFFDNIKNIQEEFEKCLITQKVSLFHNRTNFNIDFYIKKDKKEEKISLKLIYETEYNDLNDIIDIYNEPKDTNKNYIDILNDIENEIITMAKEQANLDKKIKEALSGKNTENNNINNNNINLNNNNNHITTKNQIYFSERKLKNVIRSDIIKTSEEYNLIKNKLLTKKKSKINKTINYKLLYKASTDTDNAKIFHNKCDNIKNTLTLIETDTGKKFGGFTTQTWDGFKINKKDENAFIFSLDKLKIYDIIKNSDAISSNNDFGPSFCGFQILLYDNFFKNGGKTGRAKNNYDTNIDYELTDGNMMFRIKEVEVFEIIF